MAGKAHEVESLIGARAVAQYGCVTRRQLLRAGISGDVIDRRLRIGAFKRIYRGVYFAGHGPWPPLARECAAVLICSPGAMIRGESAALAWRLPIEYDGRVQVAVVGRRIRGPRGIDVRQIGSLRRGELRRVGGIPVTSPALTLLEIAGTQPAGILAKAINEARVRRLVRADELAATVMAHEKRRGSRALARLLSQEASTLATESEAESRCLAVMVEHGLEPTRSQAEIGPYRVDFLYEPERLIVEVDGYRYHGTRYRFLHDRRRSAYLVARGYVVFPISWSDLVERPAETMRALGDALAARRAVLPAG